MTSLCNRFLPVAAIALLLAGPCAVWAQDESYHVEVIVFVRDTQGDMLYRWPGQPDLSEAIDFSPVETVERDHFFSDLPAPPVPTPLLPESSLFELLPPEQQIMQREWNNLELAAGLTPLVQLAWRQPAAAFGDPLPVRVRGGPVIHWPERSQAVPLLGDSAQEPVYEVDGSIALERGRYLHLRVDLVLNLPPMGRPAHRSDLATLQQSRYYQSWRIRQRRQVTSDVVNYFDHQNFGLIALVKEWTDTPDRAGEAR